MTRTWIITDLDGQNSRIVTMAEYARAIENGAKFIVSAIHDKHFARPAPKNLLSLAS